MIAREQLRPLVEGWLPEQRWFAGKGRSATVEVTELAEIGGAGEQIEIWTARVHYDDGSSEVYQLPLVARAEPSASLEHVLLGSVSGSDPASPVWVYDALHDKDATHAWLLGMQGPTGSVAPEPVTFTRHVDAKEIPVDETSLVLSGEQSNTSLIFGDVAILKVFRRLQAGINPDIEIHAALSERGARHVARLLGSMHAELDGAPCALAMLQEFMTTATDGWELAKASVRDLMAEADLHASEAGGDFAGEAHRLGTAIAETHADLAAAFGVSPVAAGDQQTRAKAMLASLDHAVSVVPQLADLADGLRTAFTDFGAYDGPLPVQRIHGDLHLGQALRTVHRWVVIDFEGEPMSDLAARRGPDSVLRDVSGMLRSFEYAGHYRLVETGPDPQLAYRADEWAVRNRDAFCLGYAEAAGFDPREQAVPLRAFETEKAVYEAVYEARNRPTWLPLPLASLTRLADPAGAHR